MLKEFFDFLQYLILLFFEKILRLLGIHISSHIFGTLVAIIGLFLPNTKMAFDNLKIAMPELNWWQKFKIVLGMWNNCGRTFAEFVFFNDKVLKNIEKYYYMNEKSIETAKEIADDNKNIIMFTAHFGNWEIMQQISQIYNVNYDILYRKMNNKYAEKIFSKYRNQVPSVKAIEKKDGGIIKFAKAVKNGENFALVFDLRDDRGMEVPFFNLPSLSSTTLATLILKNGYKPYSAVIYREKWWQVFFKVEIEKFDVSNNENTEENIRDITIRMNKKYEEWIRKRPEQWFWMHNRWRNIFNKRIKQNELEQRVVRFKMNMEKVGDISRIKFSIK